ncbi:L-malate glycosyltransferase [Methylomarinovum tepidoasis]|uniref:L-malate glycosyltransferase n=2 Tax=Methylomarinovum tepidoasis TaxID=2840183 RepID=A0AAU9D0F3_9GAMM|nr:L-malate glycosyltransferase [Methylomarinovum sp. IN45]
MALVGPLPPPYGGMANQTQQLADRLQAKGIDVELVPTNVPYRPRWVGRIPVLRAFFRLVPYVWSLWQVAGRRRLFHVMGNSGWSWHLFAAPAIWIASLRGCTVVLNYRGGEAENFFRRSFRWVAPTLKRCQRIVVPSGYLQSVFSHFGVQVAIIPNAVDTDRFRDAEPLDDGEGPHFLVARNLEPIYGIPIALKAFSTLLQEYPKARLWIAGSGPERPVLEELAQRLGVDERVTFTGRLTPEEIAVLYRRAHVLLNPSRVDNAPNALLEAMAAGVPIVTTDAGGVPYLVKHGETALLVPVDDHRAMAAAVRRLLKDDDLRRRLITAGRKKIEKDHTWKAVIGQWITCYTEAF